MVEILQVGTNRERISINMYMHDPNLDPLSCLLSSLSLSLIELYYICTTPDGNVQKQNELGHNQRTQDELYRKKRK